MTRKFISFILSVIIAVCSLASMTAYAASQFEPASPTSVSASWNVLNKKVNVAFKKGKNATKTKIVFGYYDNKKFHKISNTSTSGTKATLKVNAKVEYDGFVKYIVKLQSVNKAGSSDIVESKVTLTGKKYIHVYVFNGDTEPTLNSRINTFAYTGQKVKPTVYVQSSYSKDCVITPASNRKKVDAKDIRNDIKITYPNSKEAGNYKITIKLTQPGKRKYKLINKSGKIVSSYKDKFVVIPCSPKVSITYKKESNTKASFNTKIKKGKGANKTYVYTYYRTPKQAPMSVLNHWTLFGSFQYISGGYSKDDSWSEGLELNPQEAIAKLKSIDSSDADYVPTIVVLAWSETNGIRSELVIKETKI